MKKLLIMLGIILCILSILTIYSRQDQQLTSAAKTLINYQPPKVNYQQNIFVAMVGFHAAANKDFLAEGNNAINKINQQPTKNFFPSAIKLDFKLSPDLIKNCTNLPINKACWTKKSYKNEISQNLAKNTTLTKRYLQMQQLPIFADTLIYPDDIMPDYRVYSKISILLSLQALINIHNGRSEQGFYFIEQDMQFYKRILSGHATLIESLVANYKLINYYNLLSKLIADPSFDAQKYAPRLKTLLSQISLRDRRMQSGFAFEYRFTSHTLINLPKDVTKISFYKKNMTQNELAEANNAAMIYLKSINDTNFEQKRLEFNQRAKTEQKRTSLFLHLLKKHGIVFWRNAIGEILLRLSKPDFFHYLTSTYNMNACAQLVRTQLELHLAKTPANQVPDKLKQLGKKFFNPLTGKVFTWNASNKTLGFIPYKGHIQKVWATNSIEVRLP